jgi:hypothetical protein
MADDAHRAALRRRLADIRDRMVGWMLRDGYSSGIGSGLVQIAAALDALDELPLDAVRGLAAALGADLATLAERDDMSDGALAIIRRARRRAADIGRLIGGTAP